jgi:D-threonate/D-erythronate kinase
MIVVIADDLSGAAELAGAALRHGLSAEVQTTFDPAAETDLICVDTDTRSLSSDEAARLVAEVARAVAASRPEWIFKKCDSVLRGRVLPEARAVASMTGQSRIMILPANPTRGRIIREGKYFIDGQPLNQSAFSRDPEYPRASSSIVELLAGNLAGVETPDAVTFADIARHAAALTSETLAVGASDFFAALLATRCPVQIPLTPATARVFATGATLIACGSAASWSRRQGEAAAIGVPAFDLPHDVEAVVGVLRSTGTALIGIGDGPATRGLFPRELVKALARTVVSTLKRTPVARLLCEGGATTAAVVREMGWPRLRAVEISAQGLGVLQSLNGNCPVLYIKPGSYPWPAELWPNPKSN